MTDLALLTAQLSPEGTAELERTAQRIAEREAKDAALPTTGKEVAMIFAHLTPDDRKRVAKLVVALSNGERISPFGLMP